MNKVLRNRYFLPDLNLPATIPYTNPLGIKNNYLLGTARLWAKLFFLPLRYHSVQSKGGRVLLRFVVKLHIFSCGLDLDKTSINHLTILLCIRPSGFLFEEQVAAVEELSPWIREPLWEVEN